MYYDEIKFLTKIVKKAYNKCIKNKDKNVKVKENKTFLCDLITDCDLATENYIVAKIKKKYPKDNIISEETNFDNKMEGRCWILDPIDGTVCFSNNLPMWCIQSAFVVDGKCVGAVIFCPSLNEIYVATENGVTINGEKANPIIEKSKTQSILNISDLNQKNLEAYNLQIKIINEIGKKVYRIKMLGSDGYEFCAVAGNRVQAFVCFWSNIWDVVPGLYICEKMGLKKIESVINGLNVVAVCQDCLYDDLKKLLSK